ncbi:MAG: threonine/serine dehydratase [Trueperaceae bacterium]
MPLAPRGSEAPEPTLQDVLAARNNLKGVVRRTPLWPLPLALPGGHPLFVKPENLQAVGSFKIRGALNFLASMTEADRQRGVVAHSSGNHAQGVAAAARHYGVAATIVIPEGAPQLKVDNTLALGAKVVRCANNQDARESTARAVAEDTGATVVPPYDHPWIVAGQGTIGAEIVEDLPDVANVIAPIGGGGLIAGVALAVRSLAPSAQVIGAEPELAADAHESLAAGERRRWAADQVARTLADGVRTQVIGELNFRLMQRLLAGVVRVDEARIEANVGWYASRAKLVVEPTGTLSLGALQRLVEDGEVDGVRLAPGPTVVVVSGGNLDHALLAQLVGRVAAAGREDYPGSSDH